MKHIGFTGTRSGMTEEQLVKMTLIFMEWIAKGPTTLHHGDCVGADQQAHHMARIKGLTIIIHPPSDNRRRAFCDGDAETEPKPYLVRNQDIVDECSFLIAAPKSAPEEQRSGTWATVRYARKTGRDGIILWSDGSSVPLQGGKL